ncbi:MAG: lamin tail domain-containing protein [Chloroflexi bacterium]|nr:lamin tail domain-containing protein [Chloroflexota bacterium]
MRKFLLVILMIGAVVLMAACGDSDNDDKPAATPTLEPTPLPLQSTLIITVEGAGDIASEALLIEYSGTLLDVSGWQIVGSAGQTFTFPYYRLFPNASFSIFSREGKSVPAALYWGSSEALWSAGSTITILDAAGQPQAAVVVGE